MAADATQMQPAYLISGTDRAKIEAAVSRLRDRAEREGGPGSLETFADDRGGAPDPEELVASLPAMSLTASRRYLLAEEVWRWNAKALELITGALGSLPEDLTVVLVAGLEADASGADRGRAKRAIAKLEAAVKAAGGRHIECAAPRARDLPGWLADEAARRGFELSPEAARLLVERLGESTARLASELDRLAIWAEPEARVELEDLESMIADTSEEVVWTLSDAIVAGDVATASRVADSLTSQGEALTPLVYA
ncbi:MAG: DNA polymerase III subunit delta, partial [Solirubrobacterales bacterium]|nr:DNA polymerase III subunit delta [Solirubrobacterales bacterium]